MAAAATPGMERSGLTPTAFRQVGWLGGSGTGGAPPGASERLHHTALARSPVPLYM